MSPRRRLLTLAALGVIPLIVALWFPSFGSVGIIMNLALGVFAMVDLLMSASKQKILIERSVSGTLSVGAKNPVRLLVQNQNKSDVEFEISDEYPQPAEVKNLPQTARVAAWKEQEFLYFVRPHKRGRAKFNRVHFRYPSRFGLWWLREERELPGEVKVYPDIRAVNEYELMAQKNRLSEMGLKMHRLRGQGSEFERLRDYRFEDELRHIDWKATAKYLSLIHI